MEKSPEIGPEGGPRSPELEPGEYHSKVVLDIFRHADKLKAEPGQPDKTVRLTETGKQQARDRHDEMEVEWASADTTLAKGGQRERSQETAAWNMVGYETPLTGNESFEELKAYLDEGRTYGSKVGIDPRLNFVDGNGIYKEAEGRAYNTDKRGLRWLIEESEAVAKQDGDPALTPYSVAAGNVAELIKNYKKAAANFDKLLEKYKGQRPEDTMVRKLGSHLSVPDAFLSKLIEKTRGKAEQEKFVEALGGQGLDFVEGFRAEIVTPHAGDDPVVHVEYQKKDADGNVLYEYNDKVDDQTLEEIIQDRETFRNS